MLNIYRITFRWGTSKDFEKMQIFDFEADHKHAKRGGVRGQKVIRLTRKTVYTSTNFGKLAEVSKLRWPLT